MYIGNKDGKQDDGSCKNHTKLGLTESKQRIKTVLTTLIVLLLRKATGFSFLFRRPMAPYCLILLSLLASFLKVTDTGPEVVEAVVLSIPETSHTGT